MKAYFFVVDLLRPRAANQQKITGEENKAEKEIGVPTFVK